MRTLAKDSSAIVVSGGRTSVQTVFTHPLYLKNGRDHELAMVNLETHYSFAIIRVDKWTLFHIPTGCYELKAINGNSDITIHPNVNTLQCILNVVGTKLKVSFDVPNSLASVPGFNRITYGFGRHASEQLSGTLQHYSFVIHAWCTSSGRLQFLPKCCYWTEYTRSSKQFNLPPGKCRRQFNSVSVANGSSRKVVGSTWRGIDYTFLSS